MKVAIRNTSTGEIISRHTSARVADRALCRLYDAAQVKPGLHWNSAEVILSFYRIQVWESELKMWRDAVNADFGKVSKGSLARNVDYIDQFGNEG